MSQIVLTTRINSCENNKVEELVQQGTLDLIIAKPGFILAQQCNHTEQRNAASKEKEGWQE